DVSIEGATGIIINITGGSALKIHEVNEATTLIMEAAHEDAEIIFGTVIDEQMNDKVKVTVIATGLGGAAAQVARERSQASSLSSQALQPPPIPAALQAQMSQASAEQSSAAAAPVSGPNAPAGAQAAG